MCLTLNAPQYTPQHYMFPWTNISNYAVALSAVL